VNLLYLHTHDSGTYLHPDNGLTDMPGIEGLAASATTFRNVFACAPTCSPSRAGLLTGTRPHRNGMVGLAHRGFRLHDYNRHLVNFIDGRRTERVLCGVQHIAPSRDLIGYDRYLDGPRDYFNDGGIDPATYDRSNCEKVVEYLREDREREFFLSFGLLSTHRPFPSAPAGPIGLLPEGISDTAETRRDTAGFAASLRVVDEVVERITNALRGTGLWNNTAIVLTTDHGPPFPGMKGTLYDGGIATSLVVRVPGVADAGASSSALVSQLDLFPTMLEVIGADVPARTEGVSLMPLLRDPGGALREPIREEVFAETNYHANFEPARAVRTREYKLIRRYGSSAVPKAANVDDSPSKRELSARGYFSREQPREELFDLTTDPGEQINRIADPSYAELRRDLDKRLTTWMETSKDPIFGGDVPRPPGSRLNRDDAYSATEATVE
jgi:N-sulfoglucosamine sulfohydrolase